MSPTNPDPLLTVAEVAGYLDVGQTFVRSEIARGNLSHVRLGRLVRVRQSALEQYLTPTNVVLP